MAEQGTKNKVEEAKTAVREGTPEKTAAQEAPAPEEKIEMIRFSSLSELGSYINYIGSLDLLELAKPLEDKNGKVLVQKGVALRQSLFDGLQNRKPGELPGEYFFIFSKNLKTRLRKILAKKLFVCLEETHFHIAPLLLKATPTNFLAMADNILNDKEILDALIDLDKSDDPILPHLGETAITAAAFADLLCDKCGITEGRVGLVKLTFVAGLFHDIGLADDSEFLTNDIEQAKESKHEDKGREYLKKNHPKLETKIGEFVANHHRVEPLFINHSGNHITEKQIVNESICFSEYFFGGIRSIYYQKTRNTEGNPIDQVFFLIGQAIGEGYFHPLLFRIMAELQDNFKAILKYGVEIGQIEKKCLYVDSAVAYPVPRCAQILCKNGIAECKYFMASYPLKVIHSTKWIQSEQKKITPGDYFKCRLTEKLPDPPDGLV